MFSSTLPVLSPQEVISSSILPPCSLHCTYLPIRSSGFLLKNKGYILFLLSIYTYNTINASYADIDVKLTFSLIRRNASSSGEYGGILTTQIGPSFTLYVV